MSVSRVEAVECTELGEGPHWDGETQSLFFVDIFGKSVHKYCPATNVHTKAEIGNDQISLIVPVEGIKNNFLIGSERNILAINWDGVSSKATVLEKIAEIDSDETVNTNRLNDGKCDPSGRLWFGTMGCEPVNGRVAPNMGSLFNLEGNKAVKTHLEKVWISNGMAWSEDGKKMYYIDSPRVCIDEFDYDAENCSISNRTPIFSLPKHGIEGFPDGMTIDADGNLWVAVFNGYCVIKIDPRKPETLLQTIKIPAKQVTSVAFGGADLDELYVTSARFTVDGVVLNPPEHGALYKVTGLGVKGIPAVNAKI